MPLPTVSPTERGFFHPATGAPAQTVCVPVSCLYIARWFKPEIPATKAEVIALAAAAGVTDWYTVGRFNFTKLAAAMKARYGLIGTVIEGASAAQAAVLAAASGGPCAIGLAGNQLNLTPHWQSGSIGHAIAVFYPGGTTGVQLDPLAPADYAGDSFSPTEMAKFTTAAIIFAGAPKEDSMPGFKSIGPKLGRLTFNEPHALISPLDTKVHYMQPVGWSGDVYGVLDLKTPDGRPVDIEGNSPPLNNRDQVYLIDDARPNAIGAYALRQDGTFVPEPTIDPKKIARDAAFDVAQGAADVAAKYTT